MGKGHYTQNPCVTIDEYQRPHLNVLLHFYCDSNLPKWRGNRSRYDSDTSEDSAMESKAAFSDPPENNRIHIKHTTSPYYYQQAMGKSLEAFNAPESFWRRLASLFKSKGVDAEKIIDQVKKETREPSLGEQMLSARESASKLLIMLQKSGQQSQSELLKSYLNVVTAEIAMVKNGYGKYLTEQDIIDFMLKAEKGVFIDYLCNYTDLLPLDIAKKKIEIDQLRIFDNYCVMFFRKDLSAFRFIEDKLIERKLHDPILFGMVEGSDKLYYIADWTTEEDDLTLAKVEESLGRTARKVEEASINVDGKDVNWLIEHEKEIESLIHTDEEKKELTF